MSAPEKMWRETVPKSQMYPDGGAFYHEVATARKGGIEYTRTDLSQASVAAALEAAVQTLNDMLGNTLMTPDQVNAVRGAVLRIRALITDRDRVAKARAEDAKKINWSNDPTAIVEDDEPDCRGDAE